MAIGCDIKFDHNVYGIYFAGQVLSGRVDLNLDKPKKVKGVCLKICGYAQCKWSEREGTGRKAQTVHYSGRDDYISTSTYLSGSELGVHLRICGQAKTSWSESKTKFVNGKTKTADVFYQAHETYLDARTYLKTDGGGGGGGGADGGNQIELPPGLHTYSFACALPPMLPSSFEGTYGHIRYTVRVILERPWKFDQSYKVAFTVLKEFDLNYDSPIMRIPTQMEMTKSFWCGPCSSGPFSMVANIPQSGYVPGQKIIVTAEVTNMSTIPVDRMKFMLRKIISYHSQTPSTKTKNELVVIQERRAGGVAKMDHGRFQVVLPIPPEPPTNTNLCKVINITYEVKVEAKIAGPHQSPCIRIPITIGTVPLNRNVPDPKTPAIQTVVGFVEAITTQPAQYSMPQHTHGMVSAVAMANASAGIVTTGSMPPSYPGPSGSGTDASYQQLPITNALSNRAAEYPDMPPPSYEESQYGNRQIEEAEDQHPIGQQLYTPRYPVYNFDQSVEQEPVEPTVVMETDGRRGGAGCGSHSAKIMEKVDNWNH